MTDPFPPLSGKPPRSAESIRNVLNSVHEQIEQPAAGVHSSGMGDAEPLLIGALYDPDVAERLRRRLRSEGIMFTSRSRGGRIEITVDAGDRARAAAILRLHQKQDPDRPQAGIRRRHDFLIFGLLIGAMSGAAIVFGTRAIPQGAAALLTMTFLGGIGGHLLDRLSRRRKKHGLLGVGLIGLLLAVAVVGGIVALGRLLPALLQG